MRHIIDTGVLFSAKALEALAGLEDDIVLPAVAYAERVRQLRLQGRSVTELDQWLARNEIEVESFARSNATRMAIVSASMWPRAARDAMIASHVGTDDLLWTTNPRDFGRLGIPANQMVVVTT